MRFMRCLLLRRADDDRAAICPQGHLLIERYYFRIGTSFNTDPGTIPGGIIRLAHGVIRSGWRAYFRADKILVHEESADGVGGIDDAGATDSSGAGAKRWNGALPCWYRYRRHTSKQRPRWRLNSESMLPPCPVRLFRRRSQSCSHCSERDSKSNGCHFDRLLLL